MRESDQNFLHLYLWFTYCKLSVSEKGNFSPSTIFSKKQYFCESHQWFAMYYVIVDHWSGKRYYPKGCLLMQHQLTCWKPCEYTTILKAWNNGCKKSEFQSSSDGLWLATQNFKIIGFFQKIFKFKILLRSAFKEKVSVLSMWVSQRTKGQLYRTWPYCGSQKWEKSDFCVFWFLLLTFQTFIVLINHTSICFF